MNPHFIDLESYTKARPLYPAAIYAALPLSKTTPLRLLDLGSGTGLSIVSAASVFKSLEVTAFEPEIELLDFSKTVLNTLKNVTFQIHQKQVNDEVLSALPNEAFDCIQIASAWHWFYENVSASTLTDLLSHSGILFIHEYQFPKAESFHELNEWIRRQFNTLWKPEKQKPRGSLKELTQFFRECPRLVEIPSPPVKMEATFSAEELADFIFSQSRFIAFQKALTPGELRAEKTRVQETLKNLLPSPTEFDFMWRGYVFAKKGAPKPKAFVHPT